MHWFNPGISLDRKGEEVEGNVKKEKAFQRRGVYRGKEIVEEACYLKRGGTIERMER